jgi:lysozyme family protein
LPNTTDYAQIIADIIRREDDPNNPGVITNDPSDSGGRTQYGISENAHPEAWEDGEVTVPESHAIYLTKYVLPFQGIEDAQLLNQLVDMGVPSGPTAAIKTLQQIVGVNADGQLGPRTLAAVSNYPAGKFFGVPVPGFVLLNLRFRDARTLFYAALAKRRPKDLKFLLGWINRTQEFR